MAEISVEQLQTAFGIGKIVRSFGNILTQIGEGLTFCVLNDVD